MWDWSITNVLLSIKSMDLKVQEKLHIIEL